MATLAVYDSQKQKIDEKTVSDEIFAIEPKVGLLHEVVLWQMAKKRSGTACVKNRSEVSGGGKKPWRQKGTGNARQGSNTSPVWRRGGSVFGPKPRDFSYTIPKKVRKLALKMALSSRALEDKMYILRDFDLVEIKTKKMAALINQFTTDKTLIVLDEPNNIIEKSARNLPNVKVLLQAGLNVYDILNHPNLIIKEKAVDIIEERLKA